MTKRQANTIIGCIVAIILQQIVLGFAILRGQAENRKAMEITRRTAEDTQVSALDVLEMQKQAGPA